MKPVEKLLHSAAEDRRVHEALSLLQTHPDLNVNWSNNVQWTALHWASRNGEAELVKLLLAHPAINVNLQNRNGRTALLLACQYDRVKVVQMFLKDPRVNITLADNDGRTPLWWAAYKGRHRVIEWLVASGRELGDFNSAKGTGFAGTDMESTTAIEIAREKDNFDVEILLERFITDPAQTRHEVRVRLGVLNELAAEVFALTVFMCDGLLQLKPALAATSATRFFTIASKLPIELQMILCRRVVCSCKQNILHTNSEAAFKSLAIVLLTSSPSK